MIGEDRLLRFRDRIWVPGYEPLQTALIQYTHDSHLSGYLGRDTTIALLIRNYFWPGLYQSVCRFVRNYDICGRKTTWQYRKKGLLKPLLIPDRIWSELSVDFMIDLPASEPGNPRYLMVITNRLSKAITLKAMNMIEAKACAATFL